MFFKKVTCCSLLIPAVLTACGFFSGSTAISQTPQGLTDGDLVMRMKDAARQMSSFFKENEHVPSSVQEIDALLHQLEEDEKPNKQPEQFGTYRRLGFTCVALDKSIKDIPIESWRQAPPNKLNFMPACTVVILTDGENTCLIWGASISGNPILDSENKAILIYRKFEAVEKTTDK